MLKVNFKNLAQCGVGALLSVALCQPTLAAWPDDKPIEVVVGFAAGGGTDLMARKLAPFIQKRLSDKATIIVTNKPGASGEISNTHIAQAKPDGYTIGIVNVPHFLFIPMVKKAQYNPDDLRLIARVVDDPTVLVVRSDSKYSSIGSVVEALRKNPRSVSWGTNGTGSNGELAMQLIADTAKVEVNVIPYKGTSAQKTDLMGGHLDIAAISAGEVPELHAGKTGTLKVIGQFSKTRSIALPQAPTAAEAGFDVQMSSERGFAAPKGVPADIIKKLEAAISEALQDPGFITASPGDVPVLAYLPGSKWQESLAQNKKTLQALAAKAPKQ